MTNARARALPAPPPPGTVPFRPPKTMEQLLVLLLNGFEPYAHPALRSTLRRACQVATGQDQLDQLQITQGAGLRQIWERHLDQQVASGAMKASTASQYRSQLRRLIDRAVSEIAPRINELWRYPILALAELDAPHYALLDWVRSQGKMEEYYALRRFFLMMEAGQYQLADLAQQGYELTQAFYHHPDYQDLDSKTRNAYLFALRRALRLLQQAGLLDPFECYDLKRNPHYRRPWEAFPRAVLDRVDYFRNRACTLSFQHHQEWPWKPIKPRTCEAILKSVCLYLSFLMRPAEEGGVDLQALNLDQIFSREHLKAFRRFYRERNPQQNSGLTTVFEHLRTFAVRALGLDADRFARLFDVDPDPEPRLEQRRTLLQWLAIARAAQDAVPAARNQTHRQSLERFHLLLRVGLATLQRITELLHTRVEHLEWVGNDVYLRVPPEYQKKTPGRQPEWKRIPLPETLGPELRHYLNDVRPAIVQGTNNPFLFPGHGQGNNPVTYALITRQLKDFDQQVHQVPREHTTSFHLIRNTATVAMIRHFYHRGTYFASKILNHTSTETTRHHYTDEYATHLLRRDWQIRELLNKPSRTEQDLRDALQMLRQNPAEWQALEAMLLAMEASAA